MQSSAAQLMSQYISAKSVTASDLSDENKQIILGEMLTELPPEQFCIHCKGTRAVISNLITELLDGVKATQAKAEKPKQSRARKTSTKSPKK